MTLLDNEVCHMMLVRDDNGVFPFVTNAGIDSVHFKTSEPFKILCHPDFATVDFFSTIAKTKT